MVFQQPNPFATSIFINVAFGLRINKFKGNKVEWEKAIKARNERQDETSRGTPTAKN